MDTNLSKNLDTNLSKVETSYPDDPKPLIIKISLPTQAYFLSGIRDFTFNLVKNTTDFGEQWAYRFQSIIDELCNNAIEHGSLTGSEIKIVFINIPHQSIEITVEDTGSKPNHLNAEQISNLVKERRTPGYVHLGIRGRGLSKIVAEWTDELEFFDTPSGGIKVRIKKKLQNPSSQQNSSTNQSNDVNSNSQHIVLT